ncbi:hypothetical protein KAFR_0I02060 [Kazachstania africana CBS 2517]|uniref:Uncharacterized protein n=1 Tax=Kazachstania africana (strain ATCC 22294 / BCRC 22015 / CBS 2517 / CECT 1963 / NBRC 1671 / NRRL Y-8276) TaxID=1071382 RepID=H2B036_KAZAF|nr:hypothetical protein KAFR_0I02060 [Kazachstania africana CBS 2517]CCF59986.1 hypothetical protein KAFR_0I02060 [Kazachstania africana CBS 2517]
MSGEEDLETQPLLPHDERVDTREIPTEQNGRPYYKIVSAVITLLMLLISVIKLHNSAPSMEELQNDIMTMSDVTVNNVHVDGWKSGKDSGLNYDGGKFLQLTTSVDLTLNYDLLSKERSKWYHFMGEEVARSLCFKANNVTLYNTDPVQDDIYRLGSLVINKPFCIDLSNGTQNRLEVVALVEPNMKNVVRIVRKLWGKKYDQVNLWSVSDISILKDLKIGNLQIGSFRNLKIDLNEFFRFEQLSNFLGETFTEIENQFTVKEVQMQDLDKGFGIDVTSEQIDFSFLPIWDWIELPKNTLIPSLSWKPKLANCLNDYTIEIPSLNCSSENFQFSKMIQPKVAGNLVGPLPDELLSHVCWSDEENTVTPLTKLLNSLFNETERLTFQMKGEAIESTKYHQSLIPSDLLNSALDELSYFTIAPNVSFNISTLLREFNINDLRLKWLNGYQRLQLLGTIQGILDLSFYKTTEERFYVNNIKGELELFHRDNKFLEIPMKVWTNSTSRMFLDAETNNTMMELIFDINDSNLKVIDKLELSRTFNEILFYGETKVTFDSTLDIVIDSLLGEIVITGLKTSGSTVVH